MKKLLKKIGKYALIIPFALAAYTTYLNSKTNELENRINSNIRIYEGSTKENKRFNLNLFKNYSIEDKISEISKNYEINLTKELDTHKLPDNEAYITTFSLPYGRGAWGIRNIDPYYCAMRFDYVNPFRNGTNYDENSKEWWLKNHPDKYTKKLVDDNGKLWWKNKKVLVYNPENKKAVICIAQDWGPAKFVVNNAKKQIIDASHNTVKHLFGSSHSGWSSRNLVYVYFLENQALETGPVY